MKDTTHEKQDAFQPNSVTFEEGEKRVMEALRRADVNINAGILTSRDPNGRKLQEMLKVTNVPKGFHKWQLPIVLDRSQLFLTVADPEAVVPRHSHDDGDGIRFIVSGSIHYHGKELTAGDWMFIPKGVPYEFSVGAMGATMCYCYCCCCAGKLDLNFGGPVINPNPG